MINIFGWHGYLQKVCLWSFLYGILAQDAFKCILADKQCSKSNQEKTGDACGGLRQRIDQQLRNNLKSFSS
ncbi:hypothetical protein [Nostoc sp.]|uniref:hypothetical protein n=1 Tax=Nostoc sp. TaxID=1180 RepID=UPI002FFC515D